MAKLTDLSPKILMLSAAVVLLALSAAAYFFIDQDLQTANTASAASLKAKQAENDKLRPYAAQLDDMNRQIASLKDQLEQMKKIVPDEKLADQFIHLMQDTATSAGVEIRRYTAKQLNTKEFYSEAPYEMELDGPYYSMLNYFDKVRQLERIINVSGLKVANLARGGDVGARHRYNYAPSESVVATCTTTTFFSRDNFTQPGAPSAAPVKK
jgi:Tfp pilus assembly protein PilO